MRAESEQPMFQIDDRQLDRNAGHAPWGSDAFVFTNSGACTIKDVARLAGVSIATVSRVTSSSVNVSGKTKARVLAAASVLQYFPNPQAAELARAKEGSPRRRGGPRPSSVGAKVEMAFQSGAD